MKKVGCNDVDEYKNEVYHCLGGFISLCSPKKQTTVSKSSKSERTNRLRYSTFTPNLRMKNEIIIKNKKSFQMQQNHQYKKYYN